MRRLARKRKQQKNGNKDPRKILIKIIVLATVILKFIKAVKDLIN